MSFGACTDCKTNCRIHFRASEAFGGSVESVRVPACLLLLLVACVRRGAGSALSLLDVLVVAVASLGRPSVLPVNRKLLIQRRGHRL